MSSADRPRTALRIALAYLRSRRSPSADANYLTAVEQAGAIPVPLWADEPSWRDLLATADGLLLTGGGDVAPSLFGEHDEDRLCRGVDRARDARELEAFTIARERGLPVLGICRGFQLLNVLYASGSGRGKLLLDLPRTPIGHESVDGESSFHAVAVVAGTRLASLLGGSGRYEVNSRHHQGLREEQLAAGLTVSAVAFDGVVEALEAPGEPFLLGVQCHPERAGEVTAFAAVIRGLVEAAARRQAR